MIAVKNNNFMANSVKSNSSNNGLSSEALLKLADENIASIDKQLMAQACSQASLSQKSVPKLVSGAGTDTSMSPSMSPAATL